jgi:hypothetical protein
MGQVTFTGNSELRESATQQQVEVKSTREPARRAPTVAPVNRQCEFQFAFCGLEESRWHHDTRNTRRRP